MGNDSSRHVTAAGCSTVTALIFGWIFELGCPWMASVRRQSCRRICSAGPIPEQTHDVGSVHFSGSPNGHARCSVTIDHDACGPAEHP